MLHSPLKNDKPQSTLDEIRAGMGDALAGFVPYHNQLLIGIYIRPNVTSGGIHLIDQTLKEDRFQGKVGVVLAKGPMAFVDDHRNAFMDQDVDVGDWLIYRVSDGFSLDINGVHCRIIEDVHVKARVNSPAVIW